jgi:hypothetical protein
LLSGGVAIQGTMMELVYTRLAHRLNGLKRPFARMNVVKRPGEPVSRLFGDDRGQSIDRY